MSDERALVAALRAVDGVADAVVEPDGASPGSLRLQLSPGADEIAVAGAVNQLLRTRFGLAVDADRVQVLDDDGSWLSRADGAPADQATDQPAVRSAGDTASVAGGPQLSVSSTPEPGFSLARPPRLTIERVQLVSAGLGVDTTVTLGLEGRSYSGSATAAATTSSVQRGAALATLRAVEVVVGGRARFEVEHLEVGTVGPDRTVLVVVTMLTGRSQDRLTGASVVREDVRQAVIRAVLAAVNRRLEPMLEAP